MASSLVLGRKPISPETLVKITAGREPGAQVAARKNGADDVFFRVDQDTYVASGRGLPLGNLKTGDEVLLDGRAGLVDMVNNEINTPLEGAITGGKYAGIGALLGLSASSLGALGSASRWAIPTTVLAAVLLPTIVVPLLALGAVALVGRPALIAILAGAGVGAGFGALRNSDSKGMEAFGEPQG